MDQERMPSASLRDFLHVVFKRKGRILLFFGVTLGTVAVVTFMTSPTYEATAQILVKIGREDVYLPDLPEGRVRPAIRVTREEQINGEIEILKSRFLAEKVVESLGPTIIYEDLNDPARGFLGSLFQAPNNEQSPPDEAGQTIVAAMRLKRAITIEGVPKSGVINISFQHTDPLMAGTVVNKLVSLYLEHHLRVHKNPRFYAFFREQSQILRNKMERVEDRLRNFKKTHELTSNPDEDRTLLLRQEADLRVELNKTLAQEAEMENRLRNPVPDTNLLGTLVELELKERELVTKYTDESRLVQGVRDEIQMVRQRLANLDSTRYDAEMEALRARKQIQVAQLADYQRRLAELNQIETEFARLQQGVEIDRQNYKLYLRKFEQSRISEAMDTQKIANVSLIEPAKAPLKPVGPNIRLNMLLAVFTGGFGGLGLAFVSEYLDDSLEKDEDVENHLDVPVLASVPEQKT
ncbi:MAG: Wzz/FepE/Etk N-terminal domain-containing protein [Acidobacteriota bacterium]